MQDDINRQTISICIQGGKISAHVLKQALVYASKEIEKMKSNSISAHNTKKQADKEEPIRGKQKLSDLTGQKDKLANIQITDKNVGSFDRVARKYDVDYALKKDPTSTPPRYYVFFKAKDVDVMNAAFKEYTSKVAKAQQKPSVRDKLHQAMEAVKDTISQQKVRNKHQEHSR